MRAPVRHFIVFSTVVLTLAGCGRPPEPLADARPRVVALSPGIAETVAELGLGDRLVGRHAFDDATADSVPAVGDQSGVDYEALLRVRPTHVLLESSATGVPPRLAELAEARGFGVRNFPMLSISDIRATARALPEALGSPEAGQEAERLVTEIDEAIASAEDFGARTGRMLALYWTQPPGAAGPGSYHAEIILAMGGALAIADGAAYQQLDIEDLRRLDPDSIVLFMPGADAARLDDLLGPLRTADLRAVREGRVAVVNHPRCQTPGPAIVPTARQLRAAVEAWPPDFTD